MRYSRGATLLEVVIIVTILALLVMAFGGFLRGITVGGKNIPRRGSILTQQQVIDQVNILVVWLSRDVRSAALISIDAMGRELEILSSNGDIITYQFQQKNGFGTITRNKWDSAKQTVLEEKLLLQGVKGSEGFFSPTGAHNPEYVFVKLPVQYLSQTRTGASNLGEKEFSFIIVHRRVSD